MHTDKAEDFLGKGQLGGEQRSEGSQENCSTTRLAVLCHAKLLQSYPTLCDPIDYSLPGSSPGKNTGVGCHALLQGSNPCLLRLLCCRPILYL